MSILRHSKLKNCVPKLCNSPVPRFVESVRKVIDVPVYDKNGKLVETLRRRVVERSYIDPKEFSNVGIDCDMFSVENLQKAGINPTVIQTPLIKATLEQRSVVTDYIEGVDFEQFVEKKENDNVND